MMGEDRGVRNSMLVKIWPMAVAAGATLLVFLCYDNMLSHVLALPVAPRSHRSRGSTAIAHRNNLRSDGTRTSSLAATCRVQFVFAGPKYDYKDFPKLQSWVQYTDPQCAIEFVRTDHPFLRDLSADEKDVLQDSAFLPILQADLMKLLVLYYRGGLVTDLDTKPLVAFPHGWTGPDTELSTCDVVLGVEAHCYRDDCVGTLVRKGQIQNWAMWTRRRRSLFVRGLLDYVIDKFKSFPLPHDKGVVAVQEVAGSGPITDFVQFYGDFDRAFYKVPTDGGVGGSQLETNKFGILRIRKQNEEVCVVGPTWTGGLCFGADNCLLQHTWGGSWQSP
ncbi:Aste57867_15117 [Aphanomyces stellatus]|uniref:Aste57867_15117 protein n=1 Tax=Aphanomyces stellatus TaxID=120398 RepID=A0A485L531_9STRA|nr:hypothetical protein As57867_015061 [Aphanomyces stellatus]VFT91927.1 Aste57867_15117 [Aphanomyces stellatus]